MHIQESTEPGRYDVRFTWRDTDPDRPCHAVLVRMIGVTDHLYDDGDIRDHLMRPDGDGWTLTLRLPSTLRTSYQICPIRDAALDGHPAEDRWMEILGFGVRDELNPAVLPAGTTYGNPGAVSLLELPDAPPQPWYARRPDVARGTMTRHEIGAEVVHVYTPDGYDPEGEPLPLAMTFDAQWWIRLDVAATLDNLIADGAAPPMIVAAIESVPGPSRVRLLTRPGVFEPFMMGELLPWLRRQWNVTDDPARTVLSGQSLGGIAAAHLARTHPDRFGCVIGVSVAAWWPGDADGGLSGQDLIDAYTNSERVPVRFFLDVGAQERELLDAVRLMRDALTTRGYDVRYREYEGGHDFACWRGSLADGLVYALG